MVTRYNIQYNMFYPQPLHIRTLKKIMLTITLVPHQNQSIEIYYVRRQQLSSISKHQPIILG